MALSSSEEEVEPIRETKASRKRKRSPQHPKMLPTNFSDQDEELLASELLELCSAEEEEGLGVVEPRPPEVTSWKQEVKCVCPCVRLFPDILEQWDQGC